MAAQTTAASRRVRLSRDGLALRNPITPYLLILPLGIFLAAFTLFPLIWAVLISLQPPLGASSGKITTITGQNFRYTFTDPALLKSISVTVVYTLATTILVIVISMISAVALNTVRKGANTYQLFLIIPLTLAPPVVVILWQALFEPIGGAVNGVLERFGIPRQGFYESPHQALAVLITMAVWSNSGFWTLVFLSSLRSLSTSVFEAAELDGAGPLRSFFTITVPLLKRTLLLAGVVLSTAGLVVFIPAQLLTLGGPGDATNFLMYLAAQNILRYGQPGVANSIVVLILFLAGIIAAVQFLLIRSDDA